MLIGESIHEAIDWTQDQLRTTRPLAERTLFTMISEKQVKETEAGFMLVEEEDFEDRMNKIHNSVRSKSMAFGNRYRFHRARKTGKHLRAYVKKHQQLKRLEHLDNDDAADDMLNADKDID